MENVFEEPNGVYNKNRDFTSLIFLQDAMRVKLFFYKKVLPLLPKEEKWGIGKIEEIGEIWRIEEIWRIREI